MKASELRPGQSVKKVELLQAQAMVAILCQDQEHADRVYEWLDKVKNSLAVAGWDDEACETKECRCFHCGEVFDTESAAQHFGQQMVTFPACTIDVAAYRALEEEARQYREEDTDLHKQIHALHAEMHEKVRRAEEDGYARGLRDAKAHPEELGLQAVEPATSTPEPFKAGDLVVCVKGWPDGLFQDQLYRITDASGWIYIDAKGDTKGGWHRDRFRHATAAEIEQYKAEQEQQPLQLAEGKYYERRDGKVVGDGFYSQDGFRMSWWFVTSPVSVRSYAHDGKEVDGDGRYDLIREVPPPVKYRPFASAEEFKPHRDRWANCKEDSGVRFEGYTNIGASVCGEFLTWQELFERFEFDDNGEPCGVREPQ